MGDHGRYAKMDQRYWAQVADVTDPSPARVYDALLGGTNNTAADRAAADWIAAVVPSAPLVAKANRAFLMRAVRALADLGVRQFLDLGSGLPCVGSVHGMVQQCAPKAGVIYVDIDPVTVIRARELLCGNEQATVIPGDLRQPEVLLDRLTDPRLRALVDLGQPTALLMGAVTDFFEPGDGPYELVARYRGALADGSYLVLSNLATDSFAPDEVAEVQTIFRKMGAPPPQTRTRAEVLPFFDGLDLLDPGLVYAPAWRPEDCEAPWAFPEAVEKSGTHAGVGRKRDQPAG